MNPFCNKFVYSNFISNNISIENDILTTVATPCLFRLSVPRLWLFVGSLRRWPRCTTWPLPRLPKIHVKVQPSQWGKNWNSSFTKQTCFLSGVPCIFPIEGTFFLLPKNSLGFFGVRGLRAGSLAQIGFPERLSWVMEGGQKMGRFAWGVGVAAASRELPKRFLDENWFWSYDWKVP